MGIVIVLVLAIVARHTCRGARPTTAATLRISRAFSRTGSCHQGRESERIASHDESLYEAGKSEVNKTQSTIWETVKKRTKRD